MMVMVTSVLCHSSVQLEPLSVVLLNTRLAAQKMNSVRAASVLFLRRPALQVLLFAVPKIMSSAAVRLTKIASKKFTVITRSTSASARHIWLLVLTTAALRVRSALITSALFPRRPALLVLGFADLKRTNSAAVTLTRIAHMLTMDMTRCTNAFARMSSLPAATLAAFRMSSASEACVYLRNKLDGWKLSFIYIYISFCTLFCIRFMLITLRPVRWTRSSAAKLAVLCTWSAPMFMAVCGCLL